MNRNYWLDLFTGKTWEEFLNHGADVSGFRERRKKVCERINSGDHFLCYLTGLSRFVGVLEVKSRMFFDRSPIWEGEDFPCRFKVNLIHRLDPKTAIPVLELRKQLSIFKNLKSKNAWTGLFRGSPALFTADDGEVIMKAIMEAVSQPQVRE